MGTQRQLDLSTFDGWLLDGLSFCRKVYELFEQRSQPGAERDGKTPATPHEEREATDRRAHPPRSLRAGAIPRRPPDKSALVSGSQPYDAILMSSGTLVERGIVSRKLFVEITTSVHPNEHFARRLLQERGGSFGVKGISRDKKTGEIISKPHVHTNDELAMDLAAQILERLKSKSNKQYPPETVLIINCISNGIILDSEWNDAMTRVKDARLHLPFREVFLLELVMSHSMTLYGGPTGRIRE
jgi:hypothetical protein